MSNMLCDVWKRTEANTPDSSEKAEEMEKINQKLDCD